jgi:hypothetical protein
MSVVVYMGGRKGRQEPSLYDLRLFVSAVVKAYKNMLEYNAYTFLQMCFSRPPKIYFFPFAAKLPLTFFAPQLRS